MSGEGQLRKKPAGNAQAYKNYNSLSWKKVLGGLIGGQCELTSVFGRRTGCSLNIVGFFRKL